ncbi:hypothetical protein C8Q75DRAFT_123767 [Abortiporus biennis]|nr:hypothetical protein C8Q75DRAFT_123767 [Abortiporus biennis]
MRGGGISKERQSARWKRSKGPIQLATFFFQLWPTIIRKGPDGRPRDVPWTSVTRHTLRPLIRPEMKRREFPNRKLTECVPSCPLRPKMPGCNVHGSLKRNPRVAEMRRGRSVIFVSARQCFRSPGGCKASSTLAAKLVSEFGVVLLDPLDYILVLSTKRSHLRSSYFRLVWSIRQWLYPPHPIRDRRFFCSLYVGERALHSLLFAVAELWQKYDLDNEKIIQHCLSFLSLKPLLATKPPLALRLVSLCPSTDFPHRSSCAYQSHIATVHCNHS